MAGSAVFSPDHRSLAYWCESEEESDSGRAILCILNLESLNSDQAVRPENIRRIEVAEGLSTDWRGLISWSPDGKFILADYSMPGPLEFPCLVDIEQAVSDCSTSNGVLSGLSPSDLEIIRNDSDQPRGAIRWSPVDENLLAFVLVDQGVYLLDLSQNQVRQVYSESIHGLPLMPVPVWSPDGKSIALAYEVQNDETPEYSIGLHPIIQIIRLDTENESVEILDGLELYTSMSPDILPEIPEIWTTNSPYFIIDTHAWSPDGKYLLFSALIDNLHGMQGGLFVLDVQTGRVWVVKRYEKDESVSNYEWIP